MDKCLIFEPGYEGHRTEYVVHLMKFINNTQGLAGKYIFLLDERIKDSVKALSDLNQFEIIFSDFNKQHRNSIVRSFWEWRKVSDILHQQINIREIIFMEIDPNLILMNTNRFKKFKLSARGILFQPYSHFKADERGILYFYKPFLKNYIIQRIFFPLNPKIEKCFILNDKEGVRVMNKKIKGIFHFLPDPIDSVAPLPDVNTNSSVLAKYKIRKDKKILLLFGQIDGRKNLINIIESLRLFPDKIKKLLCLVVAGKLNDKNKDLYIQYIDKYKDELDIVYNNGFVTDEEREVLFQNCDVVLMPYINFYSSSGVIGHAIRHEKKVIVSSQGLLKGIVAENNLGVAVDPFSIKDINNAIDKLLFRNECLKSDNHKFILEHSPNHFSKTLLNI